MIYILENDRLKVKVSSMGAELQSIRRTADNTEYLWQGDPTYWQGRATNLFPCCGRNVEGKYTYRGETYEMAIHGFAKLQEWDVVRQKSDTLTLQIKDTPETLAMFPFHFAMEITYTLSGDDLTVALIVHNRDEKTMLFAVGGHPGFNVPLCAGESFEDYYLEFDAPCEPKRLRMSETCFYCGTADPFPLEEGTILPLRHSLFDRDAIFLQDTAGGVTLRTKEGTHTVHVAYGELPFVGFWHKPHTQAPYVCIEPWRGVPAADGGINDWEEKPENEQLEPGETYRCSYTLSFT